MKTSIYLIRQAAMEPTTRNRADAALTSFGVRQAELTRDFLAVRAIDHCYCSPQRSVVQTASILAAPHGLLPQVLSGLNDEERVLSVLDEIVERHRGESLLVVAHHRIHRRYLARVLHLPAAAARRVPLDRCGISIVVRQGNRAAVTTLNASFHLQGLAA
jgi:broad specificity phosphatase PhoE